MREESKVALRVAHLGMIQGAITRMSGFSASAKTFTITILAGLAAISVQTQATRLGVIALVATIVLGSVDIYYMTLERRFRALYDRVAGRSLDEAADLAIIPVKQSGDVAKAINSPASKLFYVPVLVASVLVVVYGLIHDQRSQRLPRADTTRAGQSAGIKPNTAGERIQRPVQSPTSPVGTAGQRVPEGHTAADPAGAGAPLRNSSSAEHLGRSVRHDPAGADAH